MLIFLSAMNLLCKESSDSRHFDVVIVGGNPGGITAAISAARQGKTSVILERTPYVGGLPVNGLGATDIHTRGATTGLFTEFTGRIAQYYKDNYGSDSRQFKDCSDGYHFEPSVAYQVFRSMIDEHKDKITVLTMRQFDAETPNVIIENGYIKSIHVLNRENGAIETYYGEVFIDATYEGDLGAAAGVPFRVGRESRDEFNEPGAGRTYEYWISVPGSGSTGEGDNAIQSYNYRLCLTDNPSNRVPFMKPDRYDRSEYLSLVEDVWTGRNTQSVMRDVTEEMLEENRRHIAAGNKTKLPGDSWGISKITNMVGLPNGKTDANNQHAAFISTDLPEENWPWPTSSWEWRDRFAQRLKDYILGLFWFAQNDSELPEHFRKAVAEWGFAKDEYQDNGYFPRQVYVREGRRFEGVYFFTAHDALPVAEGQRPPMHSSSITSSHYALDSHAVRKRESGRVHLDGFTSYHTAPYTVPYGVMLPKTISNLLLPVPVSGSHIGFSTLRMEPCWMALGQAAGVAASLAIDNGTSVQEVDVETLQGQLLKQDVTLVYFRDIHPDDTDFHLAQMMGLKGYLPEWEARLNDPVDEETLEQWNRLCGFKLKARPDKTTRLEVLKQIYRQDENARNFMFGIDNFGDKYPEGNFFNRKLMDTLGVDFVVWHLPTPDETVEAEVKRAEALGKAFDDAGLKVIVNVECGNFAKDITTADGFDWVNRPGGLHLFRLPDQMLSKLGESDAVWGVQYDELEHSQITRNLSITIEHRDKELVSLAETSGMSFAEADAAVCRGASTLLEEITSFGIPSVYTEHVWPVLFHNFARAGMTPVYKQMKENWSNVWAACAMGAALQYDKELWTCIDLWNYNRFPGHSAETLKANLQFAYWAGVDKAYVEAIGDHMYDLENGDYDSIRFKERGQVLLDFLTSYVPSNPRPYTFRDFLPEIAIVRFDDTEWGQGPDTYCPVTLEDGSIFKYFWPDRLFGAYDLNTSPASEEWIRAWHTITHGHVSQKSLSWNGVNAYMDKPYRCFAPANMPVVYDERVDRKHLDGVKLLFLCGLFIEDDTLSDIAAMVREEGLVVVTSERFAPESFRNSYTSGVQVFRDGKGKWIITDDMAHPDLKRRLKPWLGKDDEIVMRFKGNHKIRMKISSDGNSITY